MTYSADIIVNGTQATFKCNGSYDIQGESTLTCACNGNFSGIVPSCTVGMCKERLILVFFVILNVDTCIIYYRGSIVILLPIIRIHFELYSLVCCVSTNVSLHL